MAERPDIDWNAVRQSFGEFEASEAIETKPLDTTAAGRQWRHRAKRREEQGRHREEQGRDSVTVGVTNRDTPAAERERHVDVHVGVRKGLR
jgi:hypothetical protein